MCRFIKKNFCNNFNIDTLLKIFQFRRQYKFEVQFDNSKLLQNLPMVMIKKKETEDSIN